jgi:hypothetical protein
MLHTHTNTDLHIHTYADGTQGKLFSSYMHAYVYVCTYVYVQHTYVRYIDYIHAYIHTYLQNSLHLHTYAGGRQGYVNIFLFLLLSG